MKLLQLIILFLLSLVPLSGYPQVNDAYINKELDELIKIRDFNGKDSVFFKKLADFEVMLVKCNPKQKKTKAYLIAKSNLAREISEKDFTKAVKIFDECINDCNKYGYKAEESIINHDLGKLYEKNGQTEKALKIYVEDAEKFKKDKDWGAYGWALVDIGNVYFYGNLLDKAKNYYVIAQEVFSKHTTGLTLHSGNSVCYQNFGMIAKTKKSSQLALKYYRLSLNERIKDNQIANYSMLYLMIAELYFNTNNLDSAEYYYLKCVQNDKKVGESTNLVFSLMAYGNFLTETGRNKEGIDINIKAYKIAKKNDVSELIAMASNVIGLSYLKTKNLDSALYYFIISSENALKSKNLAMAERSIINTISAMEKAGKKSQTPYFYNELVKILNQKIDNNESRFQLESEIKERKIEQSDFANKRYKQRILNISLIVIIVLTSFILVIAYVGRARSRKNLARLKILNQDLRIAQHHLNRTYSIIAHDLKGPLGSVINMLDLVLKSDMNKTDSDKYLNMCNKSLNDTYSLMLNLLTWSRLKGGNIQFEPLNFDISKSINDSINLFAESTKNKSINLKFKYDGSIMVFADENMTKTIVRNLINNAIKFTNKGGEISIALYKNGNDIELIISDNGIGMTENQLEEILDNEKFVSSYGTNNESGTGLGLKLVYEFVRLNNGEISVDSRKNVGTTFYIKLPQAQ
ncbi:MAG: hypothetical protein AUJ98_01740 [Bacteroidetes bacterium CG2_30_33_31]|nr:MAG: hypothetical protein AUJ98_01740 [Bacteroidetes bacterium CG2_30_33_31]